MASYGCGQGCGVDMVYIGNGDWKCPTCGRIISFGEPDEDEDDNNYYEVGGVPVGCLACGGDYPNCKDACPMFDN